MISTVEKSHQKLRMIEACISKQEALTNDFNNRIKSLLEPEGLGNEESYDNTTQAIQSQKSAEINALTAELELAVEEMNVLKYLKTRKHRELKNVELGAVVVTSEKSFFISVSVEQFVVDGQEYCGLSTYSPLFAAMRGKRKGDEFQYNKRKYEIMDVY